MAVSSGLVRYRRGERRNKELGVAGAVEGSSPRQVSAHLCGEHKRTYKNINQTLKSSQVQVVQVAFYTVRISPKFKCQCLSPINSR